jgi:hypothetical protein
MRAALHDLMRRCREDGHKPTYADLIELDKAAGESVVMPENPGSKALAVLADVPCFDCLAPYRKAIYLHQYNRLRAALKGGA